jgi:hypothetical protein
VYHRHGLLEDISHKKLLRGVIILRNENVQMVLDFIGRYSLTLYVREVKLTEDDENILRETH